MEIFMVLYIVSAVIVFKDIKRYKSIRDVIAFIILMIIAFAFGIFYFRDPYQRSLIDYLIN